MSVQGDPDTHIDSFLSTSWSGKYAFLKIPVSGTGADTGPPDPCHVGNPDGISDYKVIPSRVMERETLVEGAGKLKLPGRPGSVHPILVRTGSIVPAMKFNF